MLELLLSKLSPTTAIMMHELQLCTPVQLHIHCVLYIGILYATCFADPALTNAQKLHEILHHQNSITRTAFHQ